MGKALHALGLFCARRWWAVLAIWAMIAVGVLGLVNVVGAETSNNLTLPGTQSQDVQDLLTEKFPPQQNGTNPIVFHVDQGKLTDSQYKSAVKAAVQGLKNAPHVYSVTGPYSSDGQNAGLMSQERAEAVAAKIARLIEAMRQCGCPLNNAYMQHSLLALVVIPELRMSDIGLVDVTKFAKTDLFVTS